MAANNPNSNKNRNLNPKGCRRFVLAPVSMGSVYNEGLCGESRSQPTQPAQPQLSVPPAQPCQLSPPCQPSPPCQLSPPCQPSLPCQPSPPDDVCSCASRCDNPFPNFPLPVEPEHDPCSPCTDSTRTSMTRFSRECVCNITQPSPPPPPMMRRSSKQSVMKSHASTQCVVSTEAISTDYYREQLQQYRADAAKCGGDAAQINGELNEIFLKRLQDIDCFSCGNVDLKLVTYQEWVDLLLHVNSVIINNVDKMEAEALERLRQFVCTTKHQQSQECENRKLRKDINSLMKFIQNAYHKSCWHFNGLQFETITPTQVLGIKEGSFSECPQDCNMNCPTQNTKGSAHVQALAVEIAQKHDEVCELKKQISTLEEEIQKAHQKIQLKDDVIRELRCDVRQVSSQQLCCSSENSEMPPVNAVKHSITPRSELSDIAKCESLQYECLIEHEHIECEALKKLQAEISDLVELNKDQRNQSIETHRERLEEMFNRINNERTEACKKLDNLRNQLMNLQTDDMSPVDNDSGYCSQSCPADHDCKIINCVRSRICHLIGCNSQLQAKVQKLHIDINDLTTKYNSECRMSQRNGEILREIADLLCKVQNKPFSYESVYHDPCAKNPFCVAIMEVHANANASSQNCEALALEVQNENLKCQLTVLQQDLCDRDAQITHLNSLLNQFSKIDSNYVTQLEQELNRVKCQSEALVKELKCAQQSEHNVQCEARQLSEQLCDAKKKNCDFILANRKLATLLKSQEDHRLGVNTKYDKLEQEYEEQCKQLRAATCKLSSLQDRFMRMEKTQQEHHMERNLLREEVLALKEKEAVLVGKCRSLEDQNNNYEQEVIRSRALIRDQQRLLQCNDIAHEETVTRLKDCNNDVKKQLCDLIADYKQLQMQINTRILMNKMRKS